MKKLKWFLISSFVFVIIAFSGLIYFVSTKITPEEIRIQAKTQLEKTFPKADIKLGKIDLSLGLSIKLIVQKFEMTYPTSKKELGLVSVEDLLVKIPIWSILTGGGDIEIRLDRPVLHYIEMKTQNNWLLAMDEKKKGRKSKTKKKSRNSSKKVSGDSSSASGTNDEEIVIPSFLTKSRLNLALNNLVIHYQLKDQTHGKVELTKFLVKNLNLESATAFEIASKMDFDLKENNKLALEMLVIGQFNLAEVFKDGPIKTKMMVKLSDVKMTSIPGNIPTIQTDLAMSVYRNGDVNGNVAVSFSERNSLKAKYNISAKKMSISDFKGALFIEDLLKLAPDAGVNLETANAQLTLEGNVSIDKKGKINPAVAFTLTPGLTYEHEGIKINLIADGFLKGKDYKLTQTTNLLGGTVSTLIDGRIDINDKKLSVETLPPIDINVTLSNLVFPKELIQKSLYPEKKAALNETQEDKKGEVVEGGEKKEEIKKVTKTKPIYLPVIKTKIVWNHLKLADEDLTGNAEILTGGSKIQTKNLSFNYSRGSGHLVHGTSIKSDRMDHNFKMSLDGIDLRGLKAFLPPTLLKSIHGIFTGKFSGTARTFNNPEVAPTYNVDVKVSAMDGMLEGINIKEHINGVFNSVSLLKRFKKYTAKYSEIDDRFKKLIFSGNLKQDNISIKNFEFLGLDNKVHLYNGKGNVYPLDKVKKGSVTVDLKDKLGLSQVLKKNIGSDVLPLRLTGIGYGLTPDYAYTSKKLAKNALNNTKAKAKKKVKAKIKKETKKVKAKAKAKVKDAAKKLFKKFGF